MWDNAHMQPPAHEQGSLERKHKRVIIIPLVLVAIFGLCAYILVSTNLSAFGLIVTQTVSAVATAALGNYLRMDHERSAVRDHARVSVRQLFDQAARMGRAVRTLEARGALLEQDPTISSERIIDWLDNSARDLRNEIDSTAQAIENWGDLAPNERHSELEKHKDRSERMPPATPSGDQRN